MARFQLNTVVEVDLSVHLARAVIMKVITLKPIFSHLRISKVYFLCFAHSRAHAHSPKTLL